MTPFRAASGAFWNSDDVRDTTSLGYTFTDVASGQSAANIINTLYGDGQVISKRDANESHIVHEYVANIVADAMGTEGSFTVFFFDGDFDEKDTDSWHSSESLMATHGFFGAMQKKGDGKALSNAGVSLTAALRRAVKDGSLDSLENDDVQQFLKKNLEIRVRMLHGEAVDATEIPGFDVVVLTADMTLAANADELPTWTRFKELKL